MKKMFSVILAFVIFNTCVLTAHAATDDNGPDNSSTGFVVIHQETPMEKHSLSGASGVTPFATFFGNGGVSTLDYLSEGYIQWSVTPTTIERYTFSGTVSIYLNGSHVRTVSCFAAGTGFRSGLVDLRNMGLKSGKRYDVYFAGSAVDDAGTVFTVSDSAHISFVYYK